MTKFFALIAACLGDVSIACGASAQQLRTINARRPILPTLAIMFKASVPILLAIVLLSLSGCASDGPKPGMVAADTGNPALGLIFAQRACASCHAVGPGEMRSPDASARPFDSIANTPGLTHTALNAWLHSSHTNMPNLIVEPENVDNLYAYLFTLKRRL